jgi:hypothetical protein
MHRLACILAFALVTPRPALADPTLDLNRLSKTLTDGQLIILVDEAGTETRASFVALTASDFEYKPVTIVDSAIAVSGDVSTLSIDRVVSVVRFDHGVPGEELYRRPGTFGALSHRLKVDMMAGVLETSGTRTVGRVSAISPGSLELDGHTFLPSGVRSIEKPAHLWDGALKGGAVALAATLIIAASTCHYGCYSVVPIALFNSGVGAAIGVGIDALVPARKYYRAPK